MRRPISAAGSAGARGAGRAVPPLGGGAAGREGGVRRRASRGECGRAGRGRPARALCPPRAPGGGAAAPRGGEVSVPRSRRRQGPARHAESPCRGDGAARAAGGPVRRAAARLDATCPGRNSGLPKCSLFQCVSPLFPPTPPPAARRSRSLCGLKGNKVSDIYLKGLWVAGQKLNIFFKSFWASSERISKFCHFYPYVLCHFAPCCCHSNLVHSFLFCLDFFIASHWSGGIHSAA